MHDESTRRIPLHGRADGQRVIVDHALVDAADYDALSAYRWHRNDSGYAIRSHGPKRAVKHTRMHRQILGLGPGDKATVDHINRDPLDNRRANLRVVQGSLENMQNLAPRNNGTSQYRGVHWDKVNRRWRATCMLNYKMHHLGRFDTEEEAAAAASAFRAKHMPYSSDAQRAA